MKTLAIIQKELKQHLRDKKANLIMILMPIVLILILSKAFSQNFSETIQFDDVKVLYTLNAEEGLKESFIQFTETLNEDLGIEFIETENKKEGLSAIKESKYACYIMIEEEIEIYKNERYNFKANLVESILRSFAQRYDAINEIAKTNPQVLAEILSNEDVEYTELKSLNSKNAPSSLDYYAITMLTLMMLYSSLTGFSTVKYEQYLKTQNRIFASPVRKHEYLTGKIIGSLAISVLQALAIFVFGKYLLNANWGNDIFTVLCIIIAECIMMVSLGACIAVLVKNAGAGSSALNIIVPLIAFLGGGYVPLSQMGSVINKMSVVSPLRWINDAIFRVIYDNDYRYVPIAVIVCLFIATVSITLTAIKTGKEKSL